MNLHSYIYARFKTIIICCKIKSDKYNCIGILKYLNELSCKSKEKLILKEYYRLLDSLVIECWHRVREVPGSIPSQGPCHTKDVIKNVPVVPLFSTQH